MRSAPSAPHRRQSATRVVRVVARRAAARVRVPRVQSPRVPQVRAPRVQSPRVQAPRVPGRRVPVAPEPLPSLLELPRANRIRPPARPAIQGKNVASEPCNFLLCGRRDNAVVGNAEVLCLTTVERMNAMTSIGQPVRPLQAPPGRAPNLPRYKLLCQFQYAASGNRDQGSAGGSGQSPYKLDRDGLTWARAQVDRRSTEVNSARAAHSQSSSPSENWQRG